jgi:carboxyl-terminal processing protease
MGSADHLAGYRTVSHGQGIVAASGCRTWLCHIHGLALAVLLAGCGIDAGVDRQTGGPWWRETCTTDPSLCQYDVARASRLFTAGYQDISDLYIEEVAISDLARAGLDGLTVLDPELGFQHDGTAVTFTHRARPVRRMSAPQPPDASNWGKLTASMVATGRSASPILGTAEAETLYEAVFDGMVTQLDRVSHYTKRSEAGGTRTGRDSKGEIGVRFRVIDEGVKILSVIEDTPAEQAGLRAWDVITDIDGQSVIGLPPREIANRLHGPIRTTVDLLIVRKPQMAKLPITATRARVSAQNVTYRTEGSTGYPRVSNFDQSTARLVRYKLKQARLDMGDELIGFILDLHGNPGGLLDQAAQVADLFLAEGRIVSTRGRHPDSHQQFDAEAEDYADGHPVVVVLDGNSASASEIVAAALQDNGRAVLVGSNSFGKGTVQTVQRLPNAGELTLTWASYLTPAGTNLDALGVLPDLCTSGDVADAADVLDRLRRGEFGPRGSTGNAAPARNDQARIAAWRAICPPHDGRPEIDLAVARALLGDAALYSRALASERTLAEVE